MRKIIKIGILLIILIFFIQCSDTTGTDEENFSVKVIVKDLDGIPVDNLKIGFSNKITPTRSSNSVRSGTVIYYSLLQDCFLSLKIYDLWNNLVKTLVYSEQTSDYTQASVFWDGTDNDGNETTFGSTAIYKTVLKAYDLENDTILFKDFQYICHDRSAYNQKSYIGITDEKGVFETDNKHLFPNFFDPPIQESYDIDGFYLGEFTLTDTIEIFLYDYTNDLIDIQEKVIRDGKNVFELIWTPEKCKKMTIDSNEIKRKNSYQHKKC